MFVELDDVPQQLDPYFEWHKAKLILSLLTYQGTKDRFGQQYSPVWYYTPGVREFIWSITGSSFFC
jgi:hypothetical protein